jgi:DNA-directed RNA polymerase specialized sigma54-like protein
VLTLVQTFDPPGVTEQSPHECLLIQLQQVPNPDSVSIEIIKVRFEDLSLRRYSKIARILKCPLDRIRESVAESLSLGVKARQPLQGQRFVVHRPRCVRLQDER